MFNEDDDDNENENDDENDDDEKANTSDGSLRVSIRYYCLTFLINPPN
jgi:hypothetical protein